MTHDNHREPPESVVVYTPERAGEEVLKPPTALPSLQGWHNDNLELAKARVIEGASYRDCSTVLLLPTRTADETLHYKVADSYRTLLAPMNQRFTPYRLSGMEIADAYNQGIQSILDHPDLGKWKFILTMESDNTPPPNGLLCLINTIYSGPWAAVGGLYWTKGENGMPMVYGNPKDTDCNFRPQIPEPETVVECRGVAMGFTLWDMKIFRDKRLQLEKGGWFQTVGRYVLGEGSSAATQDLEFCGRAGAHGYRFAVDTKVKVGHVQFEASPTHPAGFVW